MSSKSKKDKRVVFTTKKVEEIKKRMDDGFIPKRDEMPYYDGKIGLRRGGKLPFGFTKEEEEEYIKSKLDVIYFANNYCSVKQKDGKYDIIKLRDYQEDVLNMFQNPKNKFNILLASRQVGKCVSPLTKVKIIIGSEIKEMAIYEVYYTLNKPIKFLDKVKYRLYKCLEWLNN